MSAVFACAQGHTWNPRFEGSIELPGRHTACPICRRQATTLTYQDKAERAVSGDELLAGAVTLPPMEAAGAVCLPQTPTVPGHAILDELGRGGMGVVYRARNVRLNRLVALKMILAGGAADAAELARFEREAEAAARLQHPGIVQIYEVGEAEGQPFLSLEFVPGGSLARRLDGAPLPPRDAAELVEALARAMEYAHRAGVVHRDLKPANVLLAADGRPKITDFGLAKKLDDPAGPTRSGAILGTPSYMAPEQAAGEGKRIGPATDVYALGAVLYEGLTGRPPFRAAAPLETVLQVLSEEPVPPGRLNPAVGRDLETVCLKCLEKDPGKRYSSAAELVDELSRFLQHKPIRARPVTRPERLWRWCKRNPWVAALAVAVALCLGVGSAVAWGLAVHASGLAAEAADRAVDATASAERAELEKGRAQVNEEHARRNLYAAHIHLARQALEGGDFVRAEQLLAGQQPTRTGGRDYRGFEWHYLDRLCHPPGFSRKEGQDEFHCLAFSPDGARLATGAQGSTSVRIWDAASGKLVCTFPGRHGAAQSLAFSPDGRRLAAALCDGVWRVEVRDVRTGRLLLRWPGPDVLGDPTFTVAYSPDGRRLALAPTDGTVRLLDGDTGRENQAFRAPESSATSLAFSPDGERLAVGYESRGGVSTVLFGTQTLRVWDVKANRQVLAPAHDGSVNSVAYSPDGGRLATAGTSGSIQLWDARSGKRLRTVVEPFLDMEFRGNTVAFTLTGEQLLSAGIGDGVGVWDAQSGRRVASLRRESTPPVAMAVSPRGGLLACGFRHGILHVWQANHAEHGFTLDRLQPVLDLTFHPDGGRLTAGCGADVVTWSLATRKMVQTLRRPHVLPNTVTKVA